MRARARVPGHVDAPLAGRHAPGRQHALGTMPDAGASS
jgi:hypothetical protein